MYLYQPCLLSMALYEWAFCGSHMKYRWIWLLLPPAILAVSELELTGMSICVYPAGLLFPLLFLLDGMCAGGPADVLAASILGGMLCWKAADAWPLFPLIQAVCAVLLLGTATLLCRDRAKRSLACALGGLFFELFFCLREYTLFSFCVIRLGSRESLSLGAASVCMYRLLEQVRFALRQKEKKQYSF